MDKKIVGLYLRTALIAIVIIAVWGLGCPYLISAASTELTLLGIAVLIALPIMLYFLVKNTARKAAELATEVAKEIEG